MLLLRKMRVAYHASRIVPRSSDDDRRSTRDRSRSDDDATMARRARVATRVRLERCPRKVIRRDRRRGRTRDAPLVGPRARDWKSGKRRWSLRLLIDESLGTSTRTRWW